MWLLVPQSGPTTADYPSGRLGGIPACGGEKKANSMPVEGKEDNNIFFLFIGIKCRFKRLELNLRLGY